MIQFKEVKTPLIENELTPITLSDETMEKRKEKVISRMKIEKFDSIIIYADLEHGSNFEYLTGFVPRFEEALLVLHSNGKAFMVLGNENLNKASKARLTVKAIHMPHFSLPNQPMSDNLSVEEILAKCELSNCNKIGLVGWKNFTSKIEDNSELFDLPYFLVEGIKNVSKRAKLYNATYLLIGEHGARLTNNANEFAHYEFGAALAGNCILSTMEELDIGKTEMELASNLASLGQPHSVVTIMATGDRFVKANIYPTNKEIKLGDKISITTGFKGGLQSRGGYAVSSANELPDGETDYLERIAIPYYQAITTWLETIKIGINGKDLYNEIEKILPKEKYGWTLNPGHLCADEEWMSSPIYPDSNEIIESGMLFQIDIIPSVKGYGGISCESGVFLADKELRDAIKMQYPEMWKRITNRRKFMKEELGLKISEEILPTSMATAFCRPFMLNKKSAFKNI